MSRRKINMIEAKEILYRYGQGNRIREIAKSLDISRNTVRNIIRNAEALGFAKTLPEKELEIIYNELNDVRNVKWMISGNALEKLAKHHEQIEIWLRTPHMTQTQIVRLLVEQGVQTSTRSLGRYIFAHFDATHKATMHLLTVPGQQAQVDFGYVGLMLDPTTGKLRKAHVFAMVLSHSRYRFVRFVFSQNSETWIDCHIRAFEFFGGVPNTVMLDNLLSGIIKADCYDPIINRSYAELERHYHFLADPTKVRLPRHKGKIERSILLIKQRLIAGINHEDINAANIYALQWCRNDIAQEVCSTTGRKPWDLFITEEKPALQPLPTTQYEQPTWHALHVPRDHHVGVEKSYYSVPNAYIGLEIIARCGGKLVQIFYKEKLIKTHHRAQKQGTWITDEKDYPQNIQAFLNGDEKACLAEAKSIGESTSEVCKQILNEPSVTKQRKAQAVLRLAKQYTAERLESACKRALQHDNITYKCLKKILEEELDKVKSDIESKAATKQLSGGFLRAPEYFANYNN